MCSTSPMWEVSKLFNSGEVQTQKLFTFRLVWDLGLSLSLIRMFPTEMEALKKGEH